MSKLEEYEKFNGLLLVQVSRHAHILNLVWAGPHSAMGIREVRQMVALLRDTADALDRDLPHHS